MNHIRWIKRYFVPLDQLGLFVQVNNAMYEWLKSTPNINHVSVGPYPKNRVSIKIGTECSIKDFFDTLPKIVHDYQRRIVIRTTSARYHLL